MFNRTRINILSMFAIHLLSVHTGSPRPSDVSLRAIVCCCILSWASTGCVIFKRPLVLPTEKPYVAVLSGEMPPPITLVGRHAWIVANPTPTQNASLLRYELLNGVAAIEQNPKRGFKEYFSDGDVALHGVVVGNKATIEKIVACLNIETPRYNKVYPEDSYLPIPGPNSNTYVDRMMRLCNIPVDLPATAVGKDYRGIIGASITSGGTGVQFETWLAGFKIGLKEGVELHILGLTVGVDLWPPAFLLPLNPGRLGFDDR